MFVRCIALSLGLLSASAVLAEDTCKVITVSWQYDECVEADRKSADAKLNSSYKKLMARFESRWKPEPEQGKAYMAMAKDSQRAAFLDAVVPDGPSEVVDVAKVSSSASQRYGDVVARYVTTFGSPCLNVQILAPEGNWRVLSSKRFCSFNGKSFWDGYASALFEDHAFTADGLQLTLSLFELREEAEKRLACVIPIQNEQIKELKCGAPESS
ncbi:MULTISPECIES: lysozyme inhibitor LprI family protein [unclassified Pseudomonas]|uniref:lysozyme inhibitor LprI family protein n=1 Tax=unclassified Pseudomonas TaxID=196821 RepID=UPI000A1EC25C|nr:MULTISPECIES: DUF1311 domain-containing protein [unclassified Pseudomonas]